MKKRWTRVDDRGSVGMDGGDGAIELGESGTGSGLVGDILFSRGHKGG